MEVRRYWRIYKQATVNRFAVYASSRLDLMTFLLGKLIRMGFFVIIAVSLFNHTKTIAGYSEGQVILFFAVMNMIDVLQQMIWYRGMYNLKDWIRRGRFDQFLVEPVSPMFKMVGMQMDLFDVITFPVAIVYLIVALTLLPTAPQLGQILIAFMLFICSMLLAFGINLCVASLAFWTTENESAWALYRDALYVARFPSEIFPRLLRTFFLFAIPILAMVTFPAQAFMGILTPTTVLVVGAMTLLWLAIGLSLWRIGLKRYTSAGG